MPDENRAFAGWTVLRFWEHGDFLAAADDVAGLWEASHESRDVRLDMPGARDGFSEVLQ